MQYKQLLETLGLEGWTEEAEEASPGAGSASAQPDAAYQGVQLASQESLPDSAQVVLMAAAAANTAYVHSDWTSAETTQESYEDPVTHEITDLVYGENAFSTVALATAKAGVEAIVVAGGNLTGISYARGLAITVNGGTVTLLYGGANSISVTSSTDVTVNGGTVADLYGGSNTYTSASVNITVNGGTVTRLYGGSYNGTVAGDVTINRAVMT